jgi:hypothetical protein
MTKGDELLKKLFSIRPLPIVLDREPRRDPAQEKLSELMQQRMNNGPELVANQARLLEVLRKRRRSQDQTGAGFPSDLWSASTSGWPTTMLDFIATRWTDAQPSQAGNAYKEITDTVINGG